MNESELRAALRDLLHRLDSGPQLLVEQTLDMVNGVKFSMYPDDHNPPHFHVRHNEFDVSVDLRNLEITKGSLPSSQRRTMMSWARDRQQELMTLWNQMQNVNETVDRN